MQIEDFDQYRNKRWGPLSPDHPTDRRRLWAPYDRVQEALAAAVQSATRQLILAMYGFTDPVLAAAVVAKLQDPNVHCQITLDKSQSEGTTEHAMLTQYGLMDSNSVAVGTSEHGAIMHRKCLIVDLRFLLTGSTNWSVSAETKQDNELTIVDNTREAADAAIVLALEHEKARTQMGAT